MKEREGNRREERFRIEPESRHFKGQFFVLGAIIICTLFFLAFPRFAPLISQPAADMAYLSKNLQRELPHAMNLGLNESDILGRMTNFTHFLERVMLERRIGYSSMWLIIRNQSATDLNVTGGNFLGEDVTVSLNVSGAVKDLAMPNGTTNSTVFSGVGSLFNITISFGEQEKTAELARDKASLCAFYQLARGDDLIVNDITA